MEFDLLRLCAVVLFFAPFSPMSDPSPLVHFEGRWSRSERELIETAAEAAEALEQFRRSTTSQA